MSGATASPARMSIMMEQLDHEVAVFLQFIEQTPPEKWQKRCSALEALVGNIPTDLPSSDDDCWYRSPNQLHHLAVPLSQLLRDPRSSVVKLTCQHLTVLFDACRGDARLLLQSLFPSILAVHAQTVSVIRTLCQSMMMQSLPKVPCRASFPLLFEKLVRDKSRWVREACALYLSIALKSWNDAEGYLTHDLWQKAGVTLLTAVHDAHPTVRNYAREGLAIVHEANPAVFRDLEFETKDVKLQKWIRQQASFDESPLTDFLSVNSGGGAEQDFSTAATTPSSVRSVPKNVMVSTQGRPPRSTPRHGSNTVPRTRRTHQSTPLGAKQVGVKTPPRHNRTPRQGTPKVPPSPRINNPSPRMASSPLVVKEDKLDSRTPAVDHDDKTRDDPESSHKPSMQQSSMTIALSSTADDEDDTISLLDDSLHTARPTSPRLSPTNLWPGDDDNNKSKMTSNQHSKWKVIVVLAVLVVSAAAGVVCWQWERLVPSVREMAGMKSPMTVAPSDRTSDVRAIDHEEAETVQGASSFEQDTSSLPEETITQGKESTLTNSHGEAANERALAVEEEPPIDSGVDMREEEDSDDASNANGELADAASLPKEGTLGNSPTAVEREANSFPVEEEDSCTGSITSWLADTAEELPQVDVNSIEETVVDHVFRLTFLPWAPFRAGKALRKRPSLADSSSQDRIPWLIQQRMALREKTNQGQVCARALRNETAYFTY